MLIYANNNDVKISLPKAEIFNDLLKIQVLDGTNDIWITSGKQDSLLLPNQQVVDTISLTRSGDFVELFSEYSLCCEHISEF